MIFLYAFLIGGLICAIGQLLIDLFKLTPAHVTGSFVIAGTLLDFGHIYDKLIDFSGAGALVPITSFGHSLLHSMLEGGEKNGFFGLISSLFTSTALGISAAIVFGFFSAILFKPKG